MRRRVLVFRAVLALLVLTFAASGLALRAAPPAAAEATSPTAAEGRAALTTQPPATTPAPSTVVCPPVMPVVEFSAATSSALIFRYQFICAKPLTISLYSDPEGLDLVARKVTPDGVTSGTLSFTGLPSSSTYYWTYGDPHPWTGVGVRGPVKTLGPTITCQPIMPSVEFSLATSTSLTFRYQFVCGKPITIYLYKDAAATELVAKKLTPDGTPSGTITFTELPSSAEFWFVAGWPEPWSGSGPRGPVKTLPPGPYPTCPPVAPTARPVASTDTTLTFEYGVPLPDGCVDPGEGRGAVTIALYADAGGATKAVAKLATPAGSSTGRLTFGQLTPNTVYYYRYTAQDPSYDSGVAGPVRTQPAPSGGACKATFTVLATWNQGFMATVKVTSTGDAEIAWKASWYWTGGQKLNNVSNADLGGTETRPELTGKSWNRVLEPGRSAEVYLQGTGSLTTAPIPTCSRA